MKSKEEMDALKAQFVAALRNEPQANQCRHALTSVAHDGHRCYCADGLLLKTMGYIALSDFVMVNPETHHRVEGFLDLDQCTEMGIPYPPFPVSIAGSKVSLMCLNDGHKMTFSQIAEAVENEPDRTPTQSNRKTCEK